MPESRGLCSIKKLEIKAAHIQTIKQEEGWWRIKLQEAQALTPLSPEWQRLDWGVFGSQRNKEQVKGKWKKDVKDKEKMDDKRWNSRGLKFLTHLPM